MRKGYVLSLSLLVPLAVSCARPGLDLAELPLPTPPRTILEKYDTRLDMVLADFSAYRIKDKRLMWYAGKSLSGSLVDNEDKKNGFFAANQASFFVEKAGGQIMAYEIHTETQDKTAQLEASLHARWGRPDFHYRDADFSSRVWERDGRFFSFATNNTTEVMDQKTRTADLTVVAAQGAAFLSWFTSGGGFSRCGDYHWMPDGVGTPRSPFLKPLGNASTRQEF